jgi:uncharacterized protein (DUF885 family)
MIRLPALLAACAFALVACGDDGVSKEDYADDLEEVCADIEAKTEEIGQADVSGPTELSAQLDEIRAAIRDGIQRMKDIERPEGEGGEKAQAYIASLEGVLNKEVVPALDDLEQAVREKDQAKIRAAATRLQAIDEHETDQLAQDLGADGCAD